MRTKLLKITVCSLLLVTTALCQQKNGSITGVVKDTAQAVLPGARVTVSQKGYITSSNSQGQFTVVDLPPGTYKVTASYVGFAPQSVDVTVNAGQVTRSDVVLPIGLQSEVVTVNGSRQRGEVEAINVERNADNIVQVLPNEVITSLPNTNIADAVGRLPSGSLERDEGEGKYIQIRGTEPRLSNVTVDGIHLPSPENVRNVKLDVIPADLVDSIEVNKTLSANQEADAIGGSVNLVTKTPGDQPYVTLLGLGGYTPIEGGRPLYQLTGTVGNRFGTHKQFGVLVGGSYDYNARGIDDVEPVSAVNPLPNGANFIGPNTEDIRQYQYDRTRTGFTGEADYRLGNMSSVYIRGLFSKFRDFGQDWIYSPAVSNFISNLADPTQNTCGIPTNTTGTVGCGNISFANVFRQPVQQIFSVQAGARHNIGTFLLNYELALSQAKATGGYPRAGFDGPGSADNLVGYGVNVADPFVPKFPVVNGVNIYNPSAYTLSYVQLSHEPVFERDVVGAISVSKPYSVGSHFATFEVGFKGWDARNVSLFNDQSFSPNGTLLMSQFLSPFRNNDYYFKQYTAGPVTNFPQIASYLLNNPGQFSGGFSPVDSYPNDFDISERIWPGYVMNTITLGKVRLQTGLRIESTNDSLLGNVIALDSSGNLASVSPFRTDNTYTNVFPSVQAQYAITTNTIFRAAYGIGIARPNFGDLAPFVVNDPTSSIPVSAGNPNLKPTHGQNFDLLVEHYLRPVGLIQFGFFYKYLTDPIYIVTNTRTVAPFAGQLQWQPINGPHAHVDGIEMSWEQQLRFLPGLLNGLGVRANYSYTTSQASFPAGFGRTDHPALIRQAPNNLNFDVTYDKKGLSARMGLTHNDGYIWSYAFQDGTPGGIRGPGGDVYLYPHTQVDAQVSYWIPRGHGLQAIVSMLNLNNEVFGFYTGSEQFPIQREYYSRTISAGMRSTLPVGESK